MVYQQSRGVSALEHGRSVVSPDAEAKFGSLTGVHPFARDAEASSRLKAAHPSRGQGAQAIETHPIWHR